MYIARAWHVHVICTSFYSFKTAGETSGRIRMKLCKTIAAMAVNVSFWLAVVTGTNSTYQMGNLINVGYAELMKF